MSYGHSMAFSAFEYASALITVGLSVGITAPGAPAGLLWTETIGMFLGRLEFLVVIYAITKLLRDGKILLEDGGMHKVMINRIKGTQDIAFEDIEYWHFAEEAIRNISHKYAFTEIQTPIFEATELFREALADRRMSFRKRCTHLKTKAADP